MRMDDQQGSDNVEDVRGAGGFRPIHGIGIGSIAIALIGGWLF
ncbi:MAG: neutral zinc metallopeptidase, partial [Pseudomonadota bacterium]|nr:neutral zinc metallopeptidase [Pseudomonadota bacterium]